MSRHAKGQLAQYKGCTDPSRQGDTIKNEESHSTPSYPTKQSPHQVSARFTWQKHGSSLHLLAVDLPIAGLDSTLFASRQQVIEPKHIDIGEEQNEAWADDQQPEAGKTQQQIISIANETV